MSYCCPSMQDMLEMICMNHPEDDCPDQIIVCADDGGLAIPIRDGGTSAVGIDYCPWCGVPTTVEAWNADHAERAVTFGRLTLGGQILEPDGCWALAEKHGKRTTTFIALTNSEATNLQAQINGRMGEQ